MRWIGVVRKVGREPGEWTVTQDPEKRVWRQHVLNSAKGSESSCERRNGKCPLVLVYRKPLVR